MKGYYTKTFIKKRRVKQQYFLDLWDNAKCLKNIFPNLQISIDIQRCEVQRNTSTMNHFSKSYLSMFKLNCSKNEKINQNIK